MFENVTGPGAFLEAAQETAVLAIVAAMFDQAGEPGTQALIEAWQLVRGEVFEFADVDPAFDDRGVGPDIGTRNEIVSRKMMSLFFMLLALAPMACGDECLISALLTLSSSRG